MWNRWWWWWLLGNVQLDVISITVELQVMMMDNISKWQHIEEEWTKYGTLEDTLGQMVVENRAFGFLDPDWMRRQ